MPNTTQQTLELVKAAQTKPIDDPNGIAKGFTQSGSATSGLTFYDLEAPAKTLYPVMTPLRNKIARIVGGRGIQANWRAITGINTGLTGAGVSEGNRGGKIAHTTADYLASFKGIGLEDDVTFEAQYAAEGFDNVYARAVEGLLRSTMIAEESVILGGNTSQLLGTTPTPTVTDTTGTPAGTIGTQTHSVICVALGYDAYRQLGGFNNGFVGTSIDVTTATISPQITKINADGSSDTYGGGVARKSSAGTVSLTSPASALAVVTPVQGAAGYAWFWGVGGSEKLGAITTVNYISMIADATGTQTAASLPATDYSTNALVFDGLLTQAFKTSSGAYMKALTSATTGKATTLTSDGAGGISEINDAFASFWNQYRLSPDTLYVNSQELNNITNKVIAGGGTPLYRLNVDGNNPGSINAGTVVKSLLNRVTNTMVEVVVHPNMPAGTMMFYSSSIPYSLSGVGNVVRMLLRQDYYQQEWPLKTRKREYGVYFDGVLQNYFPPAFGIIYNILNG